MSIMTREAVGASLATATGAAHFKTTQMIRFTTLILSAFVACAALAQGLPTDGPLTIDPKLQALGKRLLRGKQGSMVAIEPATGRVLALVSADRVGEDINRAISKEYSPGSTFKVAQALAMLSEGTLKPETIYPCNKGFTFGGIHIGCHAHRSPLDLVGALGYSCNAYFCKAFQEMVDNRAVYPTKRGAIDRWNAYMRSMGLGEPLGVDLPGEVAGHVPNAASLSALHRNWNGATVMWMGMGQGEVTTTPLQLCNLAAMIANRGFFFTPHIHLSTADRPLDGARARSRQCLAKPWAIDYVIQGMRLAVKHGTAARIDTPAYKICGKTGTAENEGANHSIFMGFAPMNSPRIAISVFVENGGFGADLAAPLAALMIEQYLTGNLSAKSKRRAAKWENKKVKVTPVEKAVSFDDL